MNGLFGRQVEMPCEVEEDKITATFEQGEVEVVLAKSAGADVSGKRITVNKG